MKTLSIVCLDDVQPWEILETYGTGRPLFNTLGFTFRKVSGSGKSTDALTMDHGIFAAHSLTRNVLYASKDIRELLNHVSSLDTTISKGDSPSVPSSAEEHKEPEASS